MVDDVRLSISEAARALQVSPSRLRHLERRGRVRGERTPGGHRRFTTEELSRFVESASVPDEEVEGVGGDLRRKRRSLGLSLRALSQETGIAHSLLSEFERGKGRMSEARLRALEAALEKLQADSGTSRSGRLLMAPFPLVSAGDSLGLRTLCSVGATLVLTGELPPETRLNFSPHIGLELLIVLHGVVDVSLDGNHRAVPAGWAVDYPARFHHSWKNSASITSAQILCLALGAPNRHIHDWVEAPQSSTLQGVTRT